MRRWRDELLLSRVCGQLLKKFETLLKKSSKILSILSEVVFLISLLILLLSLFNCNQVLKELEDPLPLEHVQPVVVTFG